MRWTCLLAAVAPLAAAGSAPAQTAPAAQPSIYDRAVNAPSLNWQIYGANQTAKQVAATADVPGGQAVRVSVAKAAAHPYEVGATQDTDKPIAAGDTLFLVITLRAPAAKDGAGVVIPIGASEAQAPYTPISTETVQLGPTWKRYYATGVATRAYPAGKARIALQLGGAKQVVEMGPAFLLDLGPGFDRSKLPHN